MEILYEVNQSLTEEQVAAKEVKDKEYYEASKALSDPYYEKKNTIGVTALETATYEAAYKALWEEYQNWAINDGILLAVPPEEQLLRGEILLQELLDEVNSMRKELGKSLLTLK